MADLRKYMPGDFHGTTPANKMVHLMAHIGHNDELKLDVGLITRLNPMEITLQADGLLLEEDSFSLPERLTKHYEYHNGVKTAVDPRLRVGDAVIGIMDELSRYMVVDRISKSEAEEWIEPEGVVE